MAHGKKYRAAAALLETGHRYPIEEACELLPQVSTARFDATVEAHLRLGIDPRRVAVEHNLTIVPKDRYATTLLREGDRLEIVHFVGGG